MKDVFLMSPPGRSWALRGRANFRSREAAPVDAAAARREWLALAEAIEARGGVVVALPSPSDELTGLPYAAECGQLIDGGARFLLPRMAAPHRQREREHWARLAASMGIEVLDPVPEGEVWEAQGDVAELDGATLLFFGGRTTRAGMEAAAPSFGGDVLRVEIREPAFHGNMAVLPLPAADKLLVCTDVVAPDGLAAITRRFGQARIVAVTEEEIRAYATNGLPVGREILAPSVIPDRVRGLLEAMGLGVVLLPMVELCEKAGGASRCLVSRAPVDDAWIERIPTDRRLAAVAAAMRAELA